MRLLIVDPNISLNSPSMKGVVRSLPALQRAGFELEVWCWHCDPGINVSRMVRLPRLGLPRGMEMHFFGFWARLRSWWEFKVRKLPRPDVIYSVAWYLPQCDVCHVHFSPWDWERRQQSLGTRSLRDWFERKSNRLGLWTANRFLRRTTARRLLCVSDAVAADVHGATLRFGARLGILPNSYDSSRFNPDVRRRWRTVMRQTLSFAESDLVFVFVSAGHYRRKGFYLAVRAVEMLRKKHPSAKLLVVGGDTCRLRKLRRELRVLHSDWEKFVHLTGHVPDVERYFAAADALLFPSYSEAFALVEIEAAACGLPLFLTRHHGSEMILQDGVNGRYLEFDPAQMAAVLAEFVSGEWSPSPTTLQRIPDADAYARQMVEELLAAAAPSISLAGSASAQSQSLASPA